MLFYYEPVKFRLVCCAGNTLRLTLLLFCICFLECGGGGGGGGDAFWQGPKVVQQGPIFSQRYPKKFYYSEEYFN